MIQLHKYRGLIVLSFAFIILSGFTDKPTSNDNFKSVLSSDAFVLEKHQNNSFFCNESSIYLSDTRDCTIRVKTDDMDIELTLHDVSWWDCTKLKLRALWEFGF